MMNDRKDALVLIVEDNMTTLELWSSMLTALGVSHISAKDGHEALEILDERPVSMVLLDIMLPGMDGFEVMRWMRHRDMDIPIIAISQMNASSEVDYLSMAAHLGASKTVGKPLDLSKMKQIVETTAPSGPAALQ